MECRDDHCTEAAFPHPALLQYPAEKIPMYKPHQVHAPDLSSSPANGPESTLAAWTRECWYNCASNVYLPTFWRHDTWIGVMESMQRLEYSWSGCHSEYIESRPGRR